MRQRYKIMVLEKKCKHLNSMPPLKKEGHYLAAVCRSDGRSVGPLMVVVHFLQRGCTN